MKFKKKLISATMSLVVATVLMASSSYAWFTISTNPEISKIKTSITANENIEIALDNGYENAEAIDAASAVVSGTGTAGNPYTWGNLLDMSTAMTNIGANLSLKPVGYSTKTEGSETKVVMKTPQYGLDGRVAKLVDMAQEYIAAYDGVTTPSGGISIFKQTEDTDEADALALSFWLRANADVSLQLSEGTYRADDGENAADTVNAENGGGSNLTLTIPEEAAEKALSIQSQVNSILNSMQPLPSSLLYTIYESDTDNFTMIQTSWNTYYSQLENLLSETLVNLPLCYSINSDFYWLGDYSLEEMNDFMNMSQSWAFSCFEENGFLTIKGNNFNLERALFSYGSWGRFEVNIVPAQQMLRLLDKLKIRFVISTDEGTQELYAKIVPDYKIVETYVSRHDLPDEYSYQLVRNGTAYSGSVYLGFKNTYAYKELPISLSNGNQFTFQLRFYDENTPGYMDYIENLIDRAVVDEISIDEYMVDSFNFLYTDDIEVLIAAGVVESKNEIAADMENHLYEVSNRKIKASLEQFPHIDLTANEAKKVDVYMYLDGELITNADAATIDGIDLSLNLQFEKIGGATNAMTGRVYVEESESESDEE